MAIIFKNVKITAKQTSITVVTSFEDNKYDVDFHESSLETTAYLGVLLNSVTLPTIASITALVLSRSTQD